jgi:hypothetical protein
MLHLAYRFGELKHSHPSSYYKFSNGNFPRDRSRRFFNSAANRAYRIGQQIGLAHLLGAKVLTWYQLKCISNADFEELLPALQAQGEEIVISDSEDLVFDEGAL